MVEGGGGTRASKAGRVRWSIPGRSETFEGTLTAATTSLARLACRHHAARGDEIRLELHDDDSGMFTLGLARVIHFDDEGMSLQLLALGVDPALAATIRTVDLASPPPERAAVEEATARSGPPPLPIGRPEPERAPEPRAAQADKAASRQVQPLTARASGFIIGIDLGTTTTCASYVDKGVPKIIPGRTGTSTIPSMITFDPDGTFYIGQRAADRQVLYPLRTVYGSKRLIGRTYRRELAADLQEHFAYPLDEAEGQRFGVRIDDRVVSMDTIAARVLDEVRSTCEDFLKAPVDAAVITVPAYFTDVQREAVRRAAAQAKLTVHRIVNEPTAAAVAYGHRREKPSASGGERKPERIAVWDLGGGTFDFSIVDVANGQLEVVATGGDNFVGGSDFDDFLASELLSEFQRIARLSIEPDPQQIARLRSAADQAKRALSDETETCVELAEFTREPRHNLRVELTRARFDALTRPLVERTLAITKEVMQAADITVDEIDDVVLVGGSTRIPAVQTAVAELFRRRPSKRVNPDEAVAIGAAILADEVASGSAPALLDVLPMSVGRGIHPRRFEPLVARHSRVPIQRELVIDADLLGSVYFPLFQGESPDVSRNEYLCSVLVEDRSLWDRGRVRIVISFDQHCVMAIEATNARTGRPLTVQLDRSRPVEEVLRDLGPFEGPELAEAFHLPETPLGKILGKLFRVFGRR